MQVYRIVATAITPEVPSLRPHVSGAHLVVQFKVLDSVLLALEVEDVLREQVRIVHLAVNHKYPIGGVVAATVTQMPNTTLLHR